MSTSILSTCVPGVQRCASGAIVAPYQRNGILERERDIIHFRPRKSRGGYQDHRRDDGEASAKGVSQIHGQAGGALTLQHRLRECTGPCRRGAALQGE